MKFAKSSNHKSWIDLVLNKHNEKKDMTFKEERKAAEDGAVEFARGRKAQAAKYPVVSVSAEQKPGFRDEVTDEVRVTEGASKELTAFISEISGVRKASEKVTRLAGVDFEIEEFRSVKSHKDTVDNSLVTDKALICIAGKFTLPGLNKFKTAKFIVSYDANAERNYKVENTFYDESLKEHELTSVNLNNYLSTETNPVKTAKEKMLVWFNPEADTYEEVNTPSTAIKVAARLKSAGFPVVENHWVDACYDPKKFGRICVFADVSMDRVDEFKKIAALSDDEWVNRALESKKTDKAMTGEEWVKRNDEKGSYDKKEFKKADEWVGRAEEKGSKDPYKSEKTVMVSGDTEGTTIASKKEEAKKPEEPKTDKTLMDTINELDNLLK